MKTQKVKIIYINILVLVRIKYNIKTERIRLQNLIRSI